MQRQEQRERALALLHQMIEDAHQGKRQFLSGKYFGPMIPPFCLDILGQ